jgi:DNA polymerase III gamma/tau subunit
MTTKRDVHEHVLAYWRSYREHLPEMVAIYDAAVSDPEFAEIQKQIRATDVSIWRTHIKELRIHLGKPASESAALAQMVVGLLESHCYATMHLGQRGSVNTLTGFVYGGITN